MATLIKGTAWLRDGSEERFVAGPRERIKAERALKVTPTDIEAGNVGEEYIAFLVYEALRRVGKLGDVGFDAFIDEHFEDYKVDDDPESQAPLG